MVRYSLISDGAKYYYGNMIIVKPVKNIKFFHDDNGWTDIFLSFSNKNLLFYFISF